mgnify:CR=1 FL=1
MIFGLESSCDESAVALFRPEVGLCGEWIQTQIEKHQEYGGIVPDLASREHLINFPFVLNPAIQALDGEKPRLIAVTSGPGLAGCLALGVSAAKALALAWGCPLVGVNHLRGHAFSPFIERHREDPEGFESNFKRLLPHLGLIVSGGNTILFEINEAREIEIIAETVDDAAGEALDKGAKLLGMAYPGGPLIEKKATGGDPAKYDFPRAFLTSGEPKFSFSGLKTSLRYQVEKLSDVEWELELPHLCASYEEAVVDALAGKMRQIIRKDRQRWRSLGLSGGVANNGRLRERIMKLGAKQQMEVLIAERHHTGDNAGMIAFAAWMDPANTRLDSGETPLVFEPNWELTRSDSR